MISSVQRHFEAHIDRQMTQLMQSRPPERGDVTLNREEFIASFAPESKLRISFMAAFMEVMQKSEGTLDTIEGMSRLYEQMRQEIMEEFKEDQDKKYMLMGELNFTFENALRRAASPPLLPMKDLGLSLHVRQYGEREIQESPTLTQAGAKQEAMDQIIRSLRESMTEQINNFFLKFINELQNNDFEDAFASALWDLLDAESSSLENISFSDAARIRDNMLFQWSIVDENPERYINPLWNTFQTIIDDEEISQQVREEIAYLLDL